MSNSDLYQGERSEKIDAERLAQKKTPATKRARNRDSIMADPVVRAMAFIALGLIVLYLVAVVSALLTGILGSAEPRTQLERDMQYYEQKVKEDPSNTANWRQYAFTLIAAKQYSRADAVIGRAEKSVDDTATADVAIARAQLQFEQKHYDKCIETCDAIQQSLDEYYQEQRKTPGTPIYLGAPVSENYYSSLLLEAESFGAKNEPEQAIECLDEFLKDKPRASDVLTRRGAFKAEAGDTAGAEADYREALKYLPGDPAALNGLKAIGVEQ